MGGRRRYCLRVGSREGGRRGKGTFSESEEGKKFHLNYEKDQENKKGGNVPNVSQIVETVQMELEYMMLTTNQVLCALLTVEGCAGPM